MKYIEIVWNEVFMVRNAVKLDNLDIRPLVCRKRSAFEMHFHLIVVFFVANFVIASLFKGIVSKFHFHVNSSN